MTDTKTLPTYCATLPDGTEVSTTTAKRTYVKAVAARNDDGSWSLFGWVGRADLVGAKVSEVNRFNRLMRKRGQNCPDAETAVLDVRTEA